ncbi:type II toxin-antitoxin system RelE/ParE family toxin [Peptococcus simiae]|uniref:type II toxin-antitoxin system RelE/ParE family toxin n=1 Tax=Peptococcus simiae TaxID=1643805 RepID=UPI003980F7C5
MSNSYAVVYSSEAKSDLKKIYSYIAFSLFAPETAQSQINRIREAVRSLEFMPTRNPVLNRSPWKNRSMYNMPIDNFIIFYMISSNISTVTIIRIVYSGRNISEIVPSTKED